MLLKGRQRFAGVALAATLVAATMVVAASPAGAHTPQQACGSGYSVVAKPRAIKTSSGVRYGKVYLLYNSGNGKNCVVAIKERFHGVRTHADAYLKIRGNPGPWHGWWRDHGNFYHYAGGNPSPTVKFAADKCVQFFGRIYSKPGGRGTMAEGGRTKWGNCGS
jgi:hypothetical protein